MHSIMMKPLYYILCNVFLLLSIHNSYATEKYIFRQMKVNDGMSDNRARKLGISNDGILCIRTNTMVDLYNGATFIHYRLDPEHISYDENMGTSDIMFDNENRMWLQNRDHLWVLDLYTNQWTYDVETIFLKMGIKQKIHKLFIDNDKNYWLVTTDKSLYQYNIIKHKLQKISSAEYGEPRSIIQNHNTYWLYYSDNSLRCWDSLNERFTFTQKKILDNKNVERINMVVTKDGNLWIMYNQGVFFYDTQKFQSRYIKGDNLEHSDLFTSIAIDSHSNVWLGSSNSGLRIIENNTFEAKKVPLSLYDGWVVSTSVTISDILIDDNDIVWIATAKEGVLYYHNSMSKFEAINKNNTAGKLGEDNIKCLLENKDGSLILGTTKGVYLYNPATNVVSQDAPFNQLNNELCTGLYRDKANRIWLATFQNGIFCIKDQQIRHYLYDKSPVHLNYYKRQPYYNSVRTFFEDQEGNFWVSVYGGIGKFNIETGDIDLLGKRHKEIEHIKSIRNIIQLDAQTLLVGGDNGIFKYIPAKDSVIFSTKHPLYVNRTTKYNCLCKDSRNLLWLGTHDGLDVYDLAKDTLCDIGDKQNTPDNILGIVEDDNGDMWLSSPGKIVRISVKNNQKFIVNSYNSEDGMTNGTFYEHSILKGSNGTIYFGGTHGISIIKPQLIIDNSCNSIPYIYELRLFSEIIEVNKEYNGRVILEKKMPYTQSIHLKYNENVVTFKVSGLNYVNPSRTYYRYMLEGYDNTWTEICQNRQPAAISYSKLPPGKYKFLIYTANNDKRWSPLPATVYIDIAPPLWSSLPAKITYILLFIGLSILAFIYINKRQKLQRIKKEKASAENQRKELEEIKLRFFTNICHGLRTPLTLIITPVESILKKKDLSEDIKKRLDTVLRNAQNLLVLVNQILDFRKLEMKKESINTKYGIVTQFINDIYYSFRETANYHMINFEYLYENEIKAEYDQTKLLRIMNNLLSNAFKFTPKGGSVTIKVLTEQHIIPGNESAQPMLKIEINDTGIGIPENEIPNIFTRFYQVANGMQESSMGTGIGLHMVKEYVSLLQGDISINSKINEGTSFCIFLPMEYGTLSNETKEYEELLPSHVPCEHTDKTIGTDKYTILLIDDNSEFRHYLIHELCTTYDVIEACNGQEGIEQTMKNKVDLIISDIMMPVMDGVTMCGKLKASIETSHIPIILLTAKTSENDKLTGFEVGADEYLSKPFNLDMLYLRIRKLIEQRQRRIESYGKGIEVNPTEITITTIDEKLIQKALACVEKNMSNPEFSVDMLSAEVGMHRMHLYRKLNSIVGQSPSLFIRTIRLKRAAQLLQNGISVSEVAYMVGFNMPKYFTKHFKERFGMTPSKYAEQYKETSKSQQ